jgi:hypothetical protein
VLVVVEQVRWLPKSASVLVAGFTPGKSPSAADRASLRILDTRHPQGEVLRAAQEGFSHAAGRALVGAGLLAIDPLACDLRRCATHSGDPADSVVKIWDLRRADRPLMHVATPGLPRRLAFCPTGEGALSALVAPSSGGTGATSSGAIVVWMLRSSDAQRECYEGYPGGGARKGSVGAGSGGRGSEGKGRGGGGVGWAAGGSEELWSRRVETGEQVAAFDWHPSHPGRLIAVGAGDTVRDFALQFGGGVSLSPHGDLAAASAAGMFIVSAAHQAEAASAARGEGGREVKFEEDISEVMRERALRGYVLDPAANADIARGMRDDALARAWLLVGRLTQGAQAGETALVRGLEAVISAEEISSGATAAKGELYPSGNGTRRVVKRLLRGVVPRSMSEVETGGEGFPHLPRDRSLQRIAGGGFAQLSAKGGMFGSSSDFGQSFGEVGASGVAPASPGGHAGTPRDHSAQTPNATRGSAPGSGSGRAAREQTREQTPASTSKSEEAGPRVEAGAELPSAPGHQGDSNQQGQWASGGGATQVGEHTGSGRWVGTVGTAQDWLLVDVYVSESRRTALKVCEYDFGTGFDDDGDFAGSEALERRVTALERKFLYDQAALVRLLQVDLSSAVECLNKGMVAHNSDGASGAYAMASLALAGAAGSSLPVWKRAFKHAVEQCKEPYLRACFLVLARDWQAVLEEEGVAVEDRLACACRFLRDDALQAATTALVAAKMQSGQLDGLLLTGLTPRAEPLLQRYIERTADLQTAALLLCHFNTAPSLSAAARRTQHGTGWSESRRRAPLWEQWLDDYSDLLDRWQMWEHRAVLDIAMAAIAPRAAPAEVHLACTSCGRPTTLSIKSSASDAQGTLSRLPAESRSGSQCHHCDAEVQCRLSSLPAELQPRIITEVTRMSGSCLSVVSV